MAVQPPTSHGRPRWSRSRCRGRRERLPGPGGASAAPMGAAQHTSTGADRLIHDAIDQTKAGRNLPRVTMFAVMNQVMAGKCPPEPLSQFLLALNEKGYSVDEVVGAAQSLRQHMTRIPSRHPKLLDTCGTGGDGASTFNISTVAALVTAAAGVPVAKHGNRSITSKSGSSDVLECLGVNIHASRSQVEACLNEVGVCFCFAPLMHRSMMNVAEVRRQLGVPTIFNLLGPLCNPAGAPYQLLGVGRPGLRSLMAAALRELGTRRATVVAGEDGLDEVTLAAATDVSEATSLGVRETRWEPEDFGVPRGSIAPLRVQSPAESAAHIRSVLEGHRGPARDIVIMNAAAALATVQGLDQIAEAAQQAAEAIDSGRAAHVLQQLVLVSNRPADRLPP